MRAMKGLTRRQMLYSIPALGGIARWTSPAGAAPMQAAKGRLRVRSINHFGLAVSDPKRSVDFYQGLFGLPIRARHSTTTLLMVGKGPQLGWERL